MAIADTSLTSVRYVKETTFGVSPSAVAYQEIRLASEDLGQDKEVVQSDEIVTDRRPPDNIQVGSSASGDITTEPIGGQGAAYDDFWLGSIGQASAFSGHATTQTFSTGTITIDNVAGNSDRIQITHSATNWNAGFTAGVYVLVSGFIADAAGNSLTYLNSTYQVVSGAGGLTLIVTKGPRMPASPAPPRTTPTLTAGTAVVVSRYGEQVDGTGIQFFTIERKYSITNSFARLPGHTVSGFDFEMPTKKPMRVTWHFMGKEETDASATLSSTVTAAPTNKSLSPVSDMKSFSLGEDGHSFQLTKFSLKLSGGHYSQDEEAGTLGPQGIGLGTFKVTGRIEFYYEAGTIHTFYQLFQDKSITWMAGNAAGDGLGFAIPRINFTGGRRGTPGKDQSVKGWVEFQAAKGTDPLVGSAHLIKVLRR